MATELKNTIPADSIYQITIPVTENGTVTNKTYSIYDASAIHDISDLDLGQALVFKGAIPFKSELPADGNKVGDVYYVKEDDYEYVWVEKPDNETGENKGAWEEFGAPHDFVGTKDYEAHTHAIQVDNIGIQGVSFEIEVPVIQGTQETKIVFEEGSVAANTSVMRNNATLTSTRKAYTDLTKIGLKATTERDKNTKVVTSTTLPTWGATVDAGILTFSWGAGAIETDDLKLETTIDSLNPDYTYVVSGGTSENLTSKAGIDQGVAVPGIGDITLPTLKTTAANTEEEGIVVISYIDVKEEYIGGETQDLSLNLNITTKEPSKTE